MSAEYPKVIQVGLQKITVASVEDEARWRAAPVPPINHREPDPEPDSAPESEPTSIPVAEVEHTPAPAREQKTAPKKKRPPKKK